MSAYQQYDQSMNPATYYEVPIPEGVYGKKFRGRAASQAWLGMGGQGIGVRGVPGSNPGGTTTFDGVSFKWDRLEREDSEKVLGLI